MLVVKWKNIVSLAHVYKMPEIEKKTKKTS